MNDIHDRLLAMAKGIPASERINRSLLLTREALKDGHGGLAAIRNRIRDGLVPPFGALPKGFELFPLLWTDRTFGRGLLARARVDAFCP